MHMLGCLVTLLRVDLSIELGIFLTANIEMFESIINILMHKLAGLVTLLRVALSIELGIFLTGKIQMFE